MDSRCLTVVWVVLLAGTAWVCSLAADEDEKPKYTIKQVMKQAHKDGLFKKVVGGKGSHDDKAKLLELYEALAQNKPPMGSQKDWETRTKLIVAKAREVVDGKQGAEAMLKEAVNCIECHKAHRKGSPD